MKLAAAWKNGVSRETIAFASLLVGLFDLTFSKPIAFQKRNAKTVKHRIHFLMFHVKQKLQESHWHTGVVENRL